MSSSNLDEYLSLIKDTIQCLKENEMDFPIDEEPNKEICNTSSQIKIDPSFKETVKMALPNVEIIEELPPYDPPKVLLLYSQEKTAFLQRLEKAIKTHLASAKLIEIATFKITSNVKLIILPKKLSSYLTSLKNIPLLFLEEEKEYLKNSSLKASLWKTIKEKLRKK